MYRQNVTDNSGKETLPEGTMVVVVEGSNRGHAAVITGVTEHMYHLRLDNRKISRAKHKNVQAVRPMKKPEMQPTQGRSGNVEDRRQRTRAQKEAEMHRSIAEMYRHAIIVAECAEELGKLAIEEGIGSPGDGED